MESGNELIKVMSEEALLKLKSDNDGNESVAKLVDGILEGRVIEAAQEKKREAFEKGIEKTFSKLAHPDDIYNVVARWSEVEEEVVDEEAEEVEVEVVKTPAVLDKEGIITTEAVMEVVMRRPMMKVTNHKWIVETNKGITIKSGSGGDNGGGHKREVAIYKHNADGADEKLGTFPNYADFAKEKGIAIGADSARRAIERDGYYGKPVS